MMAKDSRKSKLQTHYEQCLNAFHKIDVLIKRLNNDTSDNYKVILMCNVLNVGCVKINADK